MDYSAIVNFILDARSLSDTYFADILPILAIHFSLYFYKTFFFETHFLTLELSYLSLKNYFVYLGHYVEGIIT